MHGGAERVLVNLVNFLDKDKYDVVLQTIFDCGVNKEFLKDTVKYKSNFRRIYRGVTWGMKIFSPRFLYNSLIGEEYDIIVSFLEGPTARILAGCQYKKSKKNEYKIITIELTTQTCLTLNRMGDTVWSRVRQMR